MTKTIRGALCSITLAAFLFGATPAAAEGWKATGWQCVTFARMFSGIDLYGNAATWWNKAVGKYLQGSAPKEGAVMVFKSISSMRAGHVATVSKIISDRIIKVTHANWSVINGRRGQVEKDVQVVDVSAKNDWSEVKVWYAPIKDIGLRAYPIAGFIYKDAPAKAQATAQADRVEGASDDSLPG
jgi:surface antigen